MSLRMRNLVNLVDVVLRVPPLFLIDELLRIGLGLPQSTSSSTTFPSENFTSIIHNVSILSINTTTTTGDENETEFVGVILMIALKFTASILGCVAAICVLLLWTKHLIIVYLYLASVGIVFISYWANVWTVRHVTASATSDIYLLEEILGLNLGKLFNPSSAALIVLQNYLFQSFLAFLFTYIHLGPRYNFIQKVLPISFMAPSILALLPLPHYILQHSSVFAALLPLALVKFVLWYSAVNVVQTLFQGYQYAKRVVTNFGLSQLFETEWSRLNVPWVLRTFWLLRVSEHAGELIFRQFPNPLFDTFYWFELSKNLLITGCETLTALLGMTSIVSFICHYIGCFFQWVLLTEDEDDKSIGTVSAILFYVLALQTGLTSIEPEKRFIRLGRNFCLLFTALLHFIYNIVNPLLMSLSASHNPSLHRHARALIVCAFLIMFPMSLLYYLWSHYQTSTWLLAVSAFSIEVIVKVMVSLLIYMLFLIDAYRSTFWEKLDDYVYYIKAFGNTVEFCFGIFLFFNGGWILFFESGGAIRAVMMCIHAYFNIWCEAKAGWSVFMKRRTAVNKINSLPEATDEQLQQLDDVCAICYQEMKTAKITSCNHYFHGVCLRKWLYVQDRCPLCHDILYKIEGVVADKPREQAPPPVEHNEQPDAIELPPDVRHRFMLPPLLQQEEAQENPPDQR